ncbi:MAG: hypothetical protein IKE41_02065 [Clostridia bacterium]|nr:hypothetical protein [Clostridia bacterium]MBR2735556.1 hypothetical protein [Clostridia bacterium]
MPVLNNQSPQYIWAVNTVLILIWHALIWIFCVQANASFFDPKKSIYKIHKWETENDFYNQTLKIKRWKDKLPQYTAKNGFSKKQMKNISEMKPEYIKDFIVETCRGEWDHLMCCAYTLISFWINPLFYATLFSCIVIFCNLPFIAIQRYNRLRLLKLYKKRNLKLQQ